MHRLIKLLIALILLLASGIIAVAKVIESTEVANNPDKTVPPISIQAPTQTPLQSPTPAPTQTPPPIPLQPPIQAPIQPPIQAPTPPPEPTPAKTARPIPRTEQTPPKPTKPTKTVKPTQPMKPAPSGSKPTLQTTAGSMAAGSLTFKNLKLHLGKADYHYSLDLKYPQIVGVNLNSHQVKFNRFINDLMMRRMLDYRSDVIADIKKRKTPLPKEVNKYTFHLGYHMTVIQPINFISMRFVIESYFAGEPHPEHFNFVVNYDLSNNKNLKLADLFKRRSNYLQVLSRYSEKALSGKFENKNMVKRGTSSIAENFTVWNLRSSGLLLTFGQNQVAPYYMGPQELLIPYSYLKNVLSEKSPLHRCLNGSLICQYIQLSDWNGYPFPSQFSMDILRINDIRKINLALFPSSVLFSSVYK